MDAGDELFEAIERGEVDRVCGLLAAGATPDAIQPERSPGWRPLHAAIDPTDDPAAEQRRREVLALLASPPPRPTP